MQGSLGEMALFGGDWECWDRVQGCLEEILGACETVLALVWFRVFFPALGQVLGSLGHFGRLWGNLEQDLGAGKYL